MQYSAWPNFWPTNNWKSIAQLMEEQQQQLENMRGKKSGGEREGSHDGIITKAAACKTKNDLSAVETHGSSEK